MATNTEVHDRVRDWVLKYSDFVPDDCFVSKSPDDYLRKRTATMSDFDITPRAKRARQATNPLTPSASTRDESFDVSLARSSTATSRSSSPSKKQGHIEAEFSKPAHKFHTRASARRWKEQNHRQIPLFEDLQKAIHEDIPQSQDSITFQTQLKQILDGIEQCQTRDGTEDMWSDMVVNAVLQLAKQLAQSQHYIDVINV